MNTITDLATACGLIEVAALVILSAVAWWADGRSRRRVADAQRASRRDAHAPAPADTVSAERRAAAARRFGCDRPSAAADPE
jgi:hypothetical protein